MRDQSHRHSPGANTLDESGLEHAASETLSETVSREELPAMTLGQGMLGPQVPMLRPTFVILWCKYEPERVGECARLFYGKQHVGRLHASFRKPGRMVSFGMWHPRGFADGGPLTDPHISRSLVECSWSRLGEVILSDQSSEKLMRVNRRQMQEHTCQEGDVIALGNQLLLLFSHRAFEFDQGHELEREPPFGKPDAWGEIGESPLLWQHRERLRLQEQTRRAVEQTLQRAASEVLGKGHPSLSSPPLSQRIEDIPLLMRAALLTHRALILPRQLDWKPGIGWRREPFEMKAVMWMVLRPPSSLWLLNEQIVQILNYQDVPMPFSLDILWLELPREERELLSALRERQFIMELVIRSHPSHFRKNRIYEVHWPHIKETALRLANLELERAVDLLIGQEDPELSRVLIKRLKQDTLRGGAGE